MFRADPEGIIAVVAVLMSWALAVVLYRVGAAGSVARKLSLLLVFEGLTLGTSDSAMLLLASLSSYYEQYPWVVPGQSMIHTFGDCGMIALYPPFLAAALRTKLTRPFASRRGQGISLALASVLFVFVMAGSMLFDIEAISLSVLYLAMALLFLYSFIASLHAWYIATGAARTRARIFTLAFGFRDVCWNIIYVVAMYGTWLGLDIVEHDSSAAIFILYPLGSLVAVPLIAYGILRTQLFDIDLKIRWTIKQSTFAVAVVVITFVISEGIEMLVASELGDAWGLMAAAVAVLLLKPLQAFAERMVSLLMPNTTDTEEYKSSRKIQVYEEAVLEAHAEGGISDKEWSLLTRLRHSLGISAAEAEAIEGEVIAGPVQAA